jgi:hypothetical protein
MRSHIPTEVEIEAARPAVSPLTPAADAAAAATEDIVSALDLGAPLANDQAGSQQQAALLQRVADRLAGRLVNGEILTKKDTT